MDKNFKGLERLRRIKGVQELILMEGRSVVKTCGTKRTGEKAQAIIRCCRNAGTLSRSGFEFLLFSRENQNHLLVFSAGRFSLGVIQEKGVDSLMLVGRIKRALKEIDFPLSKGVIHDG